MSAANSNFLVRPLFEGPLDLVGDVHGEIEALRALLSHLGYDESGRHAQGRRLVFLGDLTDRGPDSPAVVDLVASLVESGRAQCVLGNHDLNLLLNHSKPENQWFYGDDFVAEGKIIPQRHSDLKMRCRALDFFETLPLALERRDLRVVHACWNDAMIASARISRSALALYYEHADRIARDARSRDLDAIDRKLLLQNQNPVKIITSGPEVRTEKPHESGGKIRHERRVAWWDDYEGASLCVFGHYSIPDGQPRGSSTACCIDFGVGYRWRERLAGKTETFEFRLAALRYPEKQVVFDDGEQRAM